MSLSQLLLEKENGIATLTLNRPEKFNAMTTDMWRQLPKLIEEVAEDDSTKVLIITGAGRAFCAGSDAGRLAARVAGEKLERTRSEVIRPVGAESLLLAKMPKPTIAAINGVAAAAGMSIALACDIRIASEQARFTAGWVKIGLIPDGGATYFLSRILGVSKALELMFTGDMISAAEAERIGLVNKVVPPDDLMRVTKELANTIAKGPSVAIELMKRVAYRALDNDLESQLDVETYAQNICRGTEDHKEGIEALTQKRQPRFKGA